MNAMKAKNPPLLKKAKRITGKNLVLRDATTNDAAFIFSLRTDSRKSQHLSHTSPELEKQIAWLEAYKSKVDQAYFIIENLVGEPLGTVRLYDPQDDSFCWGSWILKDGAPQSSAIESALIVYLYAFDNLNFSYARFDTRKKNESVWKFNERLGAVRMAESEQDYHYKISSEAFYSSCQRYNKLIPETLIVEQT